MSDPYELRTHNFNTMNIENLKDEIEILLDRFKVNGESWSYFVDVADLTDYEDGEDAAKFIRQKMDSSNALTEIEHFSHTSNAIQYLAKNDPTLQNCLGIADEMGFDTGKLNSVILANLLYNKEVREQFEEDLDEFEKYFNAVIGNGDANYGEED